MSTYEVDENAQALQLEIVSSIKGEHSVLISLKSGSASCKRKISVSSVVGYCDRLSVIEFIIYNLIQFLSNHLRINLCHYSTCHNKKNYVLSF